MTRIKLQLTRLLFLSGALVSTSSFALDSDSSAPLLWQADKVAYNNKEHKTTFIGHVKFTQGSIRLYGDKAYMYLTPKNQVKKLVTFGNPAKYKSLPDPDKPELRAHSHKIDYRPIEKQVWLIGHGLVSQNNNTLQGNEIFYNLVTKTATTKASAKNKTRIILKQSKTPINPKSLSLNKKETLHAEICIIEKPPAIVYTTPTPLWTKEQLEELQNQNDTLNTDSSSLLSGNKIDEKTNRIEP